ncbi:hypothetical protein WR25_08838 [Diploscapter pachys]|uniref:Uncharacterized protein n=1 Tax=Diploscapter pachys TaxID=2018661 RepID=A0A2A2JAL6_9BILA|nr:hypothetical protein WR25_08838 [Diploscapter pachys]
MNSLSFFITNSMSCGFPNRPSRNCPTSVNLSISCADRQQFSGLTTSLAIRFTSICCGVFSPLTICSPLPSSALMINLLGSDLTGSAVNSTPATPSETISCTTTAIDGLSCCA